jgi:hypothetical protein
VIAFAAVMFEGSRYRRERQPDPRARRIELWCIVVCSVVGHEDVVEHLGVTKQQARDMPGLPGLPA